MSIRIHLTSVSIDDYDKALAFYTQKLGFQKKVDVPLGEGARWITVVSPEDPDGVQLLLEPNAQYPAMKALKDALMQDCVPYTAFKVDDTQAEYDRLKALGVEFTMEPTNIGPAIVAVMHDTCGNLIQIEQHLNP
jgi:catechol 2,3-dioxygenase-like lactoylglutathione lyase family enzyme